MAKTLVRHPGSFGIGRRPDRSVSLGARHDLPPREFSNPESRSADRPLIEGLQSGDLVAASSVHPGTGIKTREQAEADRRRAALTRNLTLTILSILAGGGSAAARNAGLARRGLLGAEVGGMPVASGVPGNAFLGGAVGSGFFPGSPGGSFRDLFGPPPSGGLSRLRGTP